MKYGRKTTSVARMRAAKEMSDSKGATFADILPLLGMGAGAVIAAPATGGVSLAGLKTIAGGAALGGSLGQGLGALASGAKEKDVARMGAGAVGLANLATDKKSADIIRKLLGGPKVTYGRDDFFDEKPYRKTETDEGITWDFLR